jgi:hypothetical protein
MTHNRKVKTVPSPTFVAKFEDGIVTRMTTHGGGESGKLDPGRGVTLACAAYESRIGKRPPRIVAGKFIEPGCYDEVLLKKYSGRALEAQRVVAPPPEQPTEEVVEAGENNAGDGPPLEQTTEGVAAPERTDAGENNAGEAPPPEQTTEEAPPDAPASDAEIE